MVASILWIDPVSTHRSLKRAMPKSHTLARPSMSSSTARVGRPSYLPTDFASLHLISHVLSLHWLPDVMKRQHGHMCMCKLLYSDWPTLHQSIACCAAADVVPFWLFRSRCTMSGCRYAIASATSTRICNSCTHEQLLT